MDKKHENLIRQLKGASREVRALILRTVVREFADYLLLCVEPDFIPSEETRQAWANDLEEVILPGLLLAKLKVSKEKLDQEMKDAELN